jgi:hypothetical protein
MIEIIHTSLLRHLAGTLHYDNILIDVDVRVDVNTQK